MKQKTSLKFTRRSFVKTGFVGAISTLFPLDYLSAKNTKLDSIIRPHGSDDANWRKIRSQFSLKRNVTYMNNASLGMPPAVVVNAVRDGYKAISEEPLHGKHDLQDRIKSEVLPSLAKMFGASAEEIVLTRNASEALHLQAIGVQLDPGDEVIITSQEHPAGLNPWMYRGEKDGIIIKRVFIPSPLKSESDVIERFSSAITSKTKAISFCHVTRGGHRYPVKKLVSMANDKGILTIVDGAQAVGQFPINLHDLGCDAYAVSLHKWILAPAGTGFLYIKKESRDRIKSAFTMNGTLNSPGFDPPGTKDFPVRTAILTAVNFVNKIGQENIEERCRYLSDYLKSGLKQIKGVKILSGEINNISAPGSTIFEKEGLDAMEAVPLIEEKIKTHIDEHQRDNHNAIRISTHIYNTTKQIDRLLNAL
ncbi:MAG: aminotransferase class V-fold PLP-dependent enzyme [Candidatus Neomarinimicrobiota bacterium]|nr:aminotransferase class V-fold PLP-dependent enzyme [Candidatus Neomarinimicrobiota bacterium]